MTSPHLRPCPSCARHVRVSEAGCPFCGASLAGAFVGDRLPSTPAARLSRAAMFAIGTGAAVVTGGCGGDSTTAVTYAPPYGGTGIPEDAGGGQDAGNPNDGGAPDTGTTTAPYGGFPVPDAGDDAGPPNDAGDTGESKDAATDAPVVFPPYGLPPGGP